MKKITIAFILLFCLATIFALSACSDKYAYVPLDATVRYLTNIPGESLTLSSGREVVSENTVFYSESVKSGDIIVCPKDKPTRQGYSFAGWAIDKEGETLFDFEKPVNGSLNLYAKWVRLEDSSSAKLEYTQPTLSFRETIDESTPFSLKGVCNQKIVGGVVNLTTASINRLTAKSSDVKEYLNYTRSSSTTITAATYQAGVVTVSHSASSDPVVVTVNDVTDTMRFTDDDSTKSIDEGSFETKAKKYEARDFDSYGVVLAGSSSMENWSTSTEDMDPVTTKNVGIGGSSSVHWLTLADRLIIPYTPRAVVLYVGINDIINYGSDGETTKNNLIVLFEHIHECLPDTLIHYILINEVPNYYKIPWKEHIDVANQGIEEYAAGKDYLNIIDAGSVLRKASGKYSEAYFLKDGLHMSVAGYQLWGPEVKKAVIAKDKEIYG